MSRSRPYVLSIVQVLGGLATAAQAQFTIVERLEMTGTVEAAVGGQLTIRDATGTKHEVRVHGPGGSRACRWPTGDSSPFRPTC
ncbi:MAG: hypothetical protein ACKO3G_15950 [Planctomycetaceae bacterium]